MNLTQLKYFIEVAKTGSFTKASERLFISQPSLSISIQKLEESLGVKLINREEQNSLTYSGEFLLSYAQNILSEIIFLETKLRQSNIHESVLKIGVLQSFHTFPIAKIIGAFTKCHPTIKIEHLSGNVIQLDEWLEEQHVDLTVNISTVEKADDIIQILFTQNYCVSIPTNHFLSGKKSLKLSDLDKLAYIDRVNCERRNEIKSLFAKHKILPEITHKTTCDILSIHLVALGKGFTIMPLQENNELNILNIPFSDIKLSRQICLKSKTANKSKNVYLFHDFCFNTLNPKSKTLLSKNQVS